MTIETIREEVKPPPVRFDMRLSVGEFSNLLQFLQGCYLSTSPSGTVDMDDMRKLRHKMEEVWLRG